MRSPNNLWASPLKHKTSCWPCSSLVHLFHEETCLKSTMKSFHSTDLPWNLCGSFLIGRLLFELFTRDVSIDLLDLSDWRVFGVPNCVGLVLAVCDVLIWVSVLVKCLYVYICDLCSSIDESNSYVSHSLFCLWNSCKSISLSYGNTPTGKLWVESVKLPFLSTLTPWSTETSELAHFFLTCYLSLFNSLFTLFKHAVSS